MPSPDLDPETFAVASDLLDPDWADAPPPGISNAVLLLMLTELRMGLGLDPDGSDTASRFQMHLGQFLQLSRAVRAHGMPWDPAAAGAIVTLRRKLRAAEPVMARLARADRRRVA